MSKMQSLILVSILVFSAALTSVSGALQSPRSTPDERHHYSYIKYVADNFGQFPVQLASIFTDRANDPNHLIHPPLYYYVMGAAHLVIKPTKDFTSVAREVDRYGKKSSVAVIPLLRAVSQFLAFLGLWGVFILVKLLVSEFGLNPWLALVAAALTTLVPAFTYIGGSLNNDVLVLGLWPFVVLSTLEFLSYEKLRYFWKSVFFYSLAVLTKATMWVLVLGLFLLLVSKLVHLIWRQGLGSVVPWRKAVFGVRRDAWLEKAWTFAALLSACFVIVVLGGNYLTYGSVQPKYTVVFNMAPEESKFHKAEGQERELAKTSILDFASMVNSGVIKSTAGILGQRERFYAKNPAQLVLIFGISVAVLVLCSLGYTANRRVPLSEKVVVTWLTFIPLLVWAVFLYKSYSDYKTDGYFSAQGRYFIGYLHILILGLFIMARNTKYPVGLLKRPRDILVCMSVVGLGFVLLRPFTYLHSSFEIYNRASVSRIVDETLVREGFTRLSVDWAYPAKALTAGYTATGKGYLEDYYTLAWHNTTLSGDIETIPDAGVLHLKIWAKGDTELGEAAKLRVGLSHASEVDPSRLVAEGIFAEVSIGDDIEVYDVPLKLSGMDKDAVVYVKLLNCRVRTKFRLERFWPMTRVPKLFGVYYKFEPET